MPAPRPPFSVPYTSLSSCLFLCILTKARDAQIIRPSRTVSSGVTLQKQAKQVISEGYVSLDDRADRKIFYVVELNDRSEYYRKVKGIE